MMNKNDIFNKKIKLALLHNFLLNQDSTPKQEQLNNPDGYIGTLVLNPGHKIWEVNYKENTIVEAEILEVNGRKKVNTKSDCIYVDALNKKNAVKKVYKRIAEAKEKTNG